MKDHVFEPVADHASGMELHRCPVPGGWVYVGFTWDPDTDKPVGAPSLAFVPDPARSVPLLDAAQGLVDVVRDLLDAEHDEVGLRDDAAVVVDALAHVLEDCRV